MKHTISLSPSGEFLLNGILITEEEATKIWNNDEPDVYWTDDALIEMNLRTNGYYREYEEDV